jgi:S-(hydroxymethyl)mycothiol dehydrogenase
VPQRVRGVVSKAQGEPVSVETVLVPDPGPGEAVVSVQACGVCHTDLHYREGGITDDYPFLLGHEAAGVVEAVGDGVTDLDPGDYVVLNWRAVCGSCRACRRGRPWYCFATFNAAQPMTLEWAKDFGATDVVDATQADVVQTVHALTGGFGADVVIDAVGRPETWLQAFYARDLAGTVVLVGVPTPDMLIELPLLDVFSRGGSLKSSWYGDCLPSRDFPVLIDLHLQGRLPLDRFVSEDIGLGDIEDAFATVHRGDVLRSVAVL